MSAEHSPHDYLAKAYVMHILQKNRSFDVQDERFGDGYSLQLGAGDSEAAIEVFPQHAFVRILTGRATLELVEVGSVTRREDRLRVECTYEFEKLAAEVSPNGSFIFSRQPRSNSSEGFEEAPRDSEAEAPRVTIRGRLGADPRFRSTARRGELVASFPLGTHPDAETTTWYSVVAFGERAKRLQEKPIAKGQEVEVVGYVHERVGRTRGGENKLSRQIYAAAIRTTLKQPPQGAE